MAVTCDQLSPEKNAMCSPDLRYRKIGLLDHMGFGNMGDVAIHESFIQNIKRRLPHARLVAFSQDPEDTRKRHDITSYPIRWRYPGWDGSDPEHAPELAVGLTLRSLLKRYRVLYGPTKRVRNLFREIAHLVRSYCVVRSLDLLIVSGGGQLCDLWWDQPYNVFKFCLLAKLSGTPVFIVGVGADRLKGTRSKIFARWTVRLANYASFRDAESQALIRSLGVKAKTHVCPDPAYGLDLRDYKIARPSNKPTGRIGLNPMGFCDPRMWPRQDGAAYKSYVDKLTRFSLWLLDQNYDVELFTTDVGVDRYAIDDLKNRVVGSTSSALSYRVTCRAASSLEELLFQMSRFDVVVTCKFHGVVFSHLLEKPVVALSYMPKIDYLMRAVGQGRYCLDIEHFDVKALIAAFESLVCNANDLTCVSRQAAATYRVKLQAEFDNLCFNG